MSRIAQLSHFCVSLAPHVEEKRGGRGVVGRSVGIFLGASSGGPSQGGGSRRGNIYLKKEEETRARPKAPFFSNKILFPSCRVAATEARGEGCCL